MRRAAHVDGNQEAIVQGLRAAGASVQHLHTVGEGCPDLLVGYRGRNTLLELKDPSQPACKRRLNDEQLVWHACWRGQTCVVETLEQALRAIGARR